MNNNAEEFAARWQGRGYEKGESQSFWIDLLGNVFGIENPTEWVVFEEQVKLDHTSFIDAHIPRTHVLIEQKSLGKDLRAPIKQSDGSVLTPFQQAKRYSSELPYTQRPRWIVTCNFSDFLVYDMERPNGEPEHIELKNLGKEYYRLSFLTDTGKEHIQREMEISIKAGRLVGELYDMLLAQYIDPNNPETLRSLNILCVRLVFCLYAEDAGVFPGHDLFHDYLASFNPQNVRVALRDLFRVLDTPEADRDPYMEENLKAFPYVNGGLFADDSIEIPRFTPEIVEKLLENASLGFDWSGISPTIFGAVFESTLNPETRRSGGMHYTSIENIHKVIDPLFLDKLERRFAEAKTDRELRQLQQHLGSLNFLDPACGSGNFLTETYISLRRLENRILKRLNKGQGALGLINDEVSPVCVSISQFYGIEINDFAVTVARTALWIAEHQMLRETQEIVYHNLDFLPLKSYNHIVEGDALRLPWSDVISQDRLNYIMGNPPFVGARLMDKEQKESLKAVFGPKWKNVGNLDFVCAWYKLAAEMMRGTQIRTALVSTNSVCQGETVANLWKPLMQQDGVHIDFAYRTFRWDSEADIKAHVHCVIIGFSDAPNPAPRMIVDGESKIECNHINAYLIEDGQDVFVDSRNKPICKVPEIGIGNKPIDGGYYLFTKEEMEEFVKSEPASAIYFRPWYGAQEFIHRKPRYCLWLGDCSPAEIRSMPKCLERVKAVREYRLDSPSPGTIKLADTPTRFHVENMPKSTYLLVPRVSSERRRYIPMGFMTPELLTSDSVQIIPDAGLYHFGVLTSNVHMAWMRAVAGRLKSDYRYSKDVVYNNFPWPEPTEEQRAEIEQTAQAILDARALYPDSSLADLYDEATMPVELRRAHQANDRAVMKAYGLPIRNFTEPDCVRHLLALYQSLTGRAGDALGGQAARLPLVVNEGNSV